MVCLNSGEGGPFYHPVVVLEPGFHSAVFGEESGRDGRKLPLSADLYSEVERTAIMKRVAVVFWFLVVIQVEVMAEPTPAVQYLMNEPVSMLDWGLYRMEEKIKKYFDFPDFPKGGNPWVFEFNYNWDSNRIMISVGIVRELDSPAKDQCRNVISAIRGYALGNFWEGVKGDPQKNGSFLAKCFSHSGYTKTDIPEGLLKEIDQIIEIQVAVLDKSIGGSKGIKPIAVEIHAKPVG